jgi:hypothetical protein
MNLENQVSPLTIGEFLDKMKKFSEKIDNCIVFLDDLCGHPMFFTEQITINGEYIIFDTILDENVNDTDMITVKKFISIINKYDNNLKMILNSSNFMFSFEPDGKSSYIDSGVISEKEDDDPIVKKINKNGLFCFVFRE